MKIALFGASGRTGRPLVREMLDRGWHVTALVRTPSKLSITDENLDIKQGDVMDLKDVAKTVEGADAVVSVIGHGKGTPSDLQESAGKKIVEAMEKNEQKRLLIMTGAGVASPGDKPGLVNKLFVLLLKLFSRKVYKDSIAYVESVRKSELDWTIVRVPRLTEGERTGKIRVGKVGVNTGVAINRADVAWFIAEEVGEPKYIQQTPMISN